MTMVPQKINALPIIQMDNEVIRKRKQIRYPKCNSEIASRLLLLADRVHLLE